MRRPTTPFFAGIALAAAWLVALVPAASHAQQWGEIANISTTMGVHAGRLCTGEASRGDIGCPTYAPYVSATSGFVGIGVNNPQYKLEVGGAIATTGTTAGLNMGDRTDGTGLSTWYRYDGRTNLWDSGSSRNLVTVDSNTGFTGISEIWDPSTTLHVGGSIRIAATNTQTCDTDRLGAIKYQSGSFWVCQSTANGWEVMATTGPNTLADRIVSGTAYVQSNIAGNVTISGTTYIGYNTGTAAQLEVGYGATANRSASLDLTGDATYTDYGLRLIRGDTGENAGSSLIHRGTGNLNITTMDQAPIVLRTNNSDALTINNLGHVGILSGSLGIASGSLNITSQNPSGYVAGFAVSNTLWRETLNVYGYPDDFATQYLRDTMMIYTGATTRNMQFTAVNADGVIRFSTGSFSNPAYERMRITGGGIGIGTTAPSTSLHVNGSIRLATETSATMAVCDPDRLGAIRYEDNNFFICRNGSIWETLVAGGSGTLDTDRITSETTAVIANDAGYVTISGTTYIGANTGQDAILEIGSNPLADRAAYLDLTGDSTYGDYGLRIIRADTGENAASQLIHRGLGNFSFQATEAASFVFLTSNSEVMRIVSTGYVGIRTTAPSSSLHIEGGIRIAADADDCDADRLGAIRYQSNQFFICRNGTDWETMLAGTLNTDRITSSTTAAVITNESGGTVSFTLGGTEGAAYLHPNLGFVGPGVSTTGTVSASDINADFMVLRGTSGTAGVSITLPGDDLGSHIAGSDLNMNGHKIINAASIGVGTSVTTPSTSLHVSGTLRISNGGENCDASRLGALKYQSGLFYLCKNTSLGWEPVQTSTSSTTPSIDTGLSGSLVFRDQFGYLKANTTYSISSTTGSVGIGAGAPAALGNNGLYASGNIQSADSIYVTSGPVLTTSGTLALIHGTNPVYGLSLAGAANRPEAVRITSNGLVGISGMSPTTALHVSGTLRISNGSESCDTSRLGAIKYETGQFYVCKNTSNGWESLATTGPNTLADRIVSGTAYVQSNVAGNVTISGTTYIGYQTNTSTSLEVGFGATGNRSSLIDLTGDTTYTDYGLRIIRHNGGANALSQIVHRGTGIFEIATTEAASIVFDTSNTESMRILPAGHVGIGTTNPSTTLHLVSNTSYQLRMGTGTAATSHGYLGTDATGITRLGGQVGTALMFGAPATAQEALRITNLGLVGISTTTPSTSLHVSGTLRISDGNESCDINRLGAIKYEAGQFYVCRNTSNGWEAMATAGSSSSIDRIVSGTSYVQANVAGNVTISGTTYIGYQTNTSTSLEVGFGATGNRSSLIDLTGDTTYTDYGLRIIRHNGGANAMSQLLHRGTGALTFRTQEAAPITFDTTGTESMRIAANGFVGISTSIPSATLHVAGAIRMAADGAQTCDTHRLGTVKYESNQFYVCRNTANGWETMATIGPNTLADRIVSGTSYVQANGPGGNVTISGTTYIGYQTATSTSLEIGYGSTASSNAVLDLTGDTTYTDYGLRLIRNGGANSMSQLLHRGTGALTLQTTEAAPIVFNTTGAEAMRIVSTGFVGIGAVVPSTSLHVVGTLRVAADAGQSCDTHRLGAIKYESNQFLVCRNVSNGWETMATIGPNTLADRIVSGTSYVQANGPGGNVTISGTTYIGYQTTTSSSLEIGYGSTASSNAVLDLTGDTTYTDYGLRLIRNGGANSMSQLLHRGTGALTLRTQEAAPIVFDTGNTESMRILPTGFVGISTSIPSATLHVAGAIRMAADGAQTCDTHRLGTVKYESNQFYVCRNVSNGWEAMATAGSSSSIDRIVSGTAYVQSNVAGNVTISGTTYIGYQTATTAALEIGSAPTANRNAHIDLTGDTTYPDFGLRVIRTNTGANAKSELIHRGTGDFRFTTQDAAPISFQTSGLERILIDTNGNIGISTSTPNAKLEVVGRTSTTTLQLSNSPADACNAAAYGTMKMVNGRPYVCRP